VQVGSP